MEQIKIYMAASMRPDRRKFVEEAAKILRERGYSVYVPMEHEIPHAWEYSNAEWGLMVFTEDISAIQESDYVVLLNWGRSRTSCGSAWEAGFAYGIGSKVVVVDMIDDDEHTSLMVENGRYVTLPNIEALKEFDFNEGPTFDNTSEEWRKYRTFHEQS